MMIEFGHSLFLLSFFLSFFYPFTLILLLLDRPKGEQHFLKQITSLLPPVLFLLLSISFLCMIRSFLLSDFSVINVIEHSHSDLPLIFQLSAVWGNHEGSILLWTWILSFYSMLYFVFYGKKRDEIFLLQLSLQGIVLLFFLFFTEFSSNPFLKVFIPFENGAELNPVLQDPVLAIHPPLIYLGYLGSIIPCSILISCLIHRYDPLWVRQETRFWSILTWSLLSFGILLGSWWAYYELGWGGWWFWDPVENSSLIPWIFGTALLHALLSSKMRLWTILLSFLTFLCSILGTFFVRSGFLESVHSFANDSSRGMIILSFFLFLLFSLLYLLWTRRDFILPEEETMTFVWNKSSVLSIQIFLLSFTALIVLLGTFYPFLYRLLFGDAISVGASFFHGLLGPLMAPFLLLMSLALFVPWRVSSLPQWFTGKSNFVFFYILFLLFLGVIGVVFLPQMDLPLEMSFVYFCILCGLCIGTTLGYAFWAQRKSVNLGMTLSHIGFAIFFLGALTSSLFQSEIAQIMRIGDVLHFEGLDYVLQSTNQLNGPNYSSFYASLVGLKDSVPYMTMYPEKRYYSIQGIYATKPYVLSSLGTDMYVLFGDGNPLDGWEIKMYRNPLMSWIWMGGLLVILGGIRSFWKNKGT